MTQEDPRIVELRRVRAKALEGGGEERIKKQKAKGKLTARERVRLLLDPGTFNEIEPFITHQGDEMNLLNEKYYGDLWDDARVLCVTAEYFRISAHRAHTFLNTRAARIDQRDERHAIADSQIHDTANFV